MVKLNKPGPPFGQATSEQTVTGEVGLTFRYAVELESLLALLGESPSTRVPWTACGTPFHRPRSGRWFQDHLFFDEFSRFSLFREVESLALSGSVYAFRVGHMENRVGPFAERNSLMLGWKKA